MLKDQDTLIEKTINLSPGKYTPMEIIRQLSEAGISISYSQAALLQDTVVINQPQNLVKDVLPMIFDLKKYNYVIRKNKIMVVPLAQSNIRSHSGFKEEPDNPLNLVLLNKSANHNS